MLKHQNVKMFLQKVTFQIGLKKCLWLKKLEILFRGHILLVILKVKKLLEHFTKKNCKKINQRKFRVQKVIKRKGDTLYVKWKGYDNYFNSWIDKKDIVYMSEYFPQPKSWGGRVKVELDLSNYVTKTDLKNATGGDTSDVAKKVDLATLKPDIDGLKSTIDELGIS